MPNDLDPVSEIKSRTRRIETRLVKFMKAMGHDPRIQGEDVMVDVTTRVVRIPTLDTAFVDVVNSARRAGLHGTHVTVFAEGIEESIATIKV